MRYERMLTSSGTSNDCSVLTALFQTCRMPEDRFLHYTDDLDGELETFLVKVVWYKKMLCWLEISICYR